MGLVYAAITIKNPRDANLRPIEVQALVDSGAIVSCIPESIAIELGLEEQEQRMAKMADGKVVKVPYVGPLQYCFDNRSCFGGAMVMGDVMLLGAVQMEDMDLIIHPRDQKLSVHPDRPNIAGAMVTSFKEI